MARKTQRRKRPLTKEEVELEGSDTSENSVNLAVGKQHSNGNSDESDLDTTNMSYESSDDGHSKANDHSNLLEGSDIEMSDATISAQDDDSDSDMDVSGALIPTPVQGRKSKKSQQKNGSIMDNDMSEDDNNDDDDDASFINQQIQSNNKKKKKSGGFQSMGMLSLY
jgi:hypothetical protein